MSVLQNVYQNILNVLINLRIISTEYMGFNKKLKILYSHSKISGQCVDYSKP